MSSHQKNRKQVVANGTTTTSNGVVARNNNDDDADSALDPPTFSLPSDFLDHNCTGGGGDTTTTTTTTTSTSSCGNSNNSRYELWTIRLPSSINVLDLQDCRLTVPLSLSANTTSSNNSTTATTTTDCFESNGSKYTFTWGHCVENESFRVLVPLKRKKAGTASSEDDDDDNDDNDSTTETSRDKSLVPCHIPFARHLTIVQQIMSSEQDWAPRCGPAPDADADTTEVRRAYAPISQKSGLKRRWVALGGGVLAAAAARSIPMEALQGTSSSSAKSTASKTHNHDTFETSKPSKRVKRETDRTESSDSTSIAIASKNEPTVDVVTPQQQSLLENNQTLEEQRLAARKAAKRAKKAAKKAKQERTSEQKVKKEQDND
jgi:hypothetical protein